MRYTNVRKERKRSTAVVPARSVSKRVKATAKTERTKSHPLLPLRDVVIFPDMVAPLLVGRRGSIKAVEEAMINEHFIVLATQKSRETDEPTFDDIFPFGTISKVLHVIRLPEGTLKVLIEGIGRVRIKSFVEHENIVRVTSDPVFDRFKMSPELKGLMRTSITLFEKYADLNSRIPTETRASLHEIEKPDKLADIIAATMTLKISDKQRLLETASCVTRLKELNATLNTEIEILEIEKKITRRVRRQIDKSQRRYYLSEQLKAIEKELGREGGLRSELQELKKKIEELGMTEEAKEKAYYELARLFRMHTYSPEASVSRTYLDWLMKLPWKTATPDNLDIAAAKRVLNRDHFGLKQPKERIVEYLAVRKLTKKIHGPVLCFVGPPGVGKTSLAQSVARAMGRKFIRISLGGCRDEADIRGHRRTYVGALPGRILSSLRKAGSKNPVFLLDEIDKISKDYHGDPAAALLEVLDPEQNNTFNDHYLEVGFDLSDVMFITTANVKYALHPTLRDRMECIELGGYSEWEKLEIGRRFLIPKQTRETGIRRGDARFSDDALLNIIRNYTRESGVREMERQINKVCRKAAKKFAEGKNVQPFVVDTESLSRYLGKQKYEQAAKVKITKPGIATGLAWTEFGGDILHIESSVMKGKGRFMLTGQLGEVMKESAKAALTYIRTSVNESSRPENFYNTTDIHVHVPEGSIPKDGPSAGIGIAASLYSALSSRPCRNDIALTGEMTLRGQVLPVGGVKEKVLAAHRASITSVMLPQANKKDVDELPAKIRKEINFILITNVEEMFQYLFAAHEKK